MLHIAVCDDDEKDLEAVLELLCKYQSQRPDIKIYPHRFDTTKKLLEKIKEKIYFDLFLLDILLPDFTGMEFARELRKKDKNVPLIFLTYSTDYALDAFGVSAAQYILKPIEEKKFFTALDNVIAARKHENEEFFLVSTPESKIKVRFSSIVYIESAARALKITLTDQSVIYSKKIRVPFSDLISPLLESKSFLYSHKSFILNMEHVDKLTGNSFIMKGGAEIPIPRYKYAEAKIIYMDYLAERDILIFGGKS